MSSSASIEEQLSLSELDWGRIGAAVVFTMSGVEQLLEKWNRVLGDITSRVTRLPVRAGPGTEITPLSRR